MEEEGDRVLVGLTVPHALLMGVALALPDSLVLTDTERDTEGLPLPVREGVALGDPDPERVLVTQGDQVFEMSGEAEAETLRDWREAEGELVALAWLGEELWEGLRDREGE